VAKARLVMGERNTLCGISNEDEQIGRKRPNIPPSAAIVALK
jgi:hypothetical protein